MKRVEEDLGKIDILTNNARITIDAIFYKLTFTQGTEVIDTNFNGVFNMTHAIWSGILDQMSERVINILLING